MALKINTRLCKTTSYRNRSVIRKMEKQTMVNLSRFRFFSSRRKIIESREVLFWRNFNTRPIWKYIIKLEKNISFSSKEKKKKILIILVQFYFSWWLVRSEEWVCKMERNIFVILVEKSLFRQLKLPLKD